MVERQASSSFYTGNIDLMMPEEQCTCLKKHSCRGLPENSQQRQKLREGIGGYSKAQGCTLQEPLVQRQRLS